MCFFWLEGWLISLISSVSIYFNINLWSLIFFFCRPNSKYIVLCVSLDLSCHSIRCISSTLCRLMEIQPLADETSRLRIWKFTVFFVVIFWSRHLNVHSPNSDVFYQIHQILGRSFMFTLRDRVPDFIRLFQPGSGCSKAKQRVLFSLGGHSGPCTYTWVTWQHGSDLYNSKGLFAYTLED